MISSWPSGHRRIVSSISSRHFIGRLQISHHGYSKPCVRFQSTAYGGEYTAKSALQTIESKLESDPINPARSVRPPPLTLPVRADASTVFIYWFRIGKAYGTFYKEGVKAVWFNYQASKLLRTRLKELGAADEVDAVKKRLISRAEWQLLARNHHDIGKLPLFGLLALTFGEWLPVLVPFMPAVVPGTCRIPKQVVGMRASAEKRRGQAFRRGIPEPQLDHTLRTQPTSGQWPLEDASQVRAVLDTLRPDQLHHLSSSLNLHNRLWDILQIAPPSTSLRRVLTRHLHYITLDDKLLLEAGKAEVVNQLLSDELAIACGERGLNVTGEKDTELRVRLHAWLQRQKQDQGRGSAILTMLFRR